MTWKPHVTVAAIVQRGTRFLLVEEEVNGQLVLNQPAGHVEDGESLTTAVVRETLEETAWDFAPEAVVGLYLWKEPTQGDSFLRTAFSGRCEQHHADRTLDTGVRRALWLTREEIVAQSGRLRSPLVLLCVDDYLRGRRFPLNLVQHLNNPPPLSGTS